MVTMGRQLIDHGDKNIIGISFFFFFLAGQWQAQPGAAKWVEHSCPRSYIISISRCLCCHGLTYLIVVHRESFPFVISSFKLANLRPLHSLNLQFVIADRFCPPSFLTSYC